MNLYKSIIITALSLLLLESCDVNEEIRLDNEATNYEEIKFHVSNYIHHHISSKKDTTIIIKDGISISYNAEIGGECGVDTLNMTLKVYTSVYDIVIDGLHTSCDSGILESGGMMYFNVTNDVNKEVLAKAFKVDFPDDKKDQNMELYTRDSSSTSNWEREVNVMPGFYSEDMTKEEIRNVIDTYFETNIFQLNKFGWINCDAFLEFENLIDYNILCEDKNVLFYTIFTNSNTLLLGTPSGDNIYKLGKLPTGEPVTILGIAYEDGVPFFNMIDTVIKEQKLKFPKLKATTKEELKRVIDTKFGESFI